MDLNHDYCRWSLKETQKELPAEISQRDFSVCKTGFGDYTIEGPNRFYWFGNACCKWEAKAKAISEYVTKHGAKE